MPATRSRTSTEAPEVAVEDKKTSDVTEQQPEAESEVKETATEATTETSAEQSSAVEKPVEENTNGSTNDALPSDINGDEAEDKVENGSAKRKSTGDEGGDAPDSTDISPKKVKLDAEAADESNGDKKTETGAAEDADKQTPVETSA